jgi:hypothetical protein
MPIDYSRLQGASAGGPLIEPRQIFASLPLDRARYPYMRDVQGETLERWFDRRHEGDLVLKMNTGGGKTVVGLLALQSSLNEGAGPALYLCSDNYLVEQVTNEAAALGIDYTTEPRSAEYRTAQAICITNIYRLFNGRTVFGLAADSRLPIGTVLIDDAHACLATVRSQFRLSVPSAIPAYKELFDVVYPSLEQQSRGRAEELRSGDPFASMPVPPWAWTAEQARIVPILARAASQDTNLGFVWPLVRDVLHLCRVAVSAREIQIAPLCVPVAAVPSFRQARRRLYLTATLADDSVLVTDFDADASTVAKPIVPTSASDIGDRLILSPLETHPALDHSTLRHFLKGVSATHNTVVIAPSDKSARGWADVADRICTADTIGQAIDDLRAGHVGLVVFSNRYDGVDLPGSACRILVIDGLPSYASPLELAEAEMVDGTEQIARSQMQRVEQGMGRGVRSNDDFCVVVLSDLRLADEVWSNGERHFTPATAAQLQLSRQVVKQLKGADLDEFRSAIDSVINRDPGWVGVSRSVVAPLKSSTESTISALAIAERRAFDRAESGRPLDAVDALRATFLDLDRPTRGWAKQLAATYLFATDPVAANALQASAREDNRAAFRPLGFQPSRAQSKANRPQGELARQWLVDRYTSPDRLLLSVEALLDRLRPDPATTADFERAMAELAQLLGFEGSRPEQEEGVGPDVLWSLGELRYLVIECKSGSISDVIHKTELAQLGHSADWFHATHDSSCSATPVILHPARQCGPAAVAAPDMRVLTFAKLDALRDAVRGFATALSTQPTFETSAINERLAAADLHANGFVDRWTVHIRAAT